MTLDSSTPLQIIQDAICTVAPDIEPSEIGGLDRDELLRDALEIDSMDQMNIAATIYERTGIDIPERDYTHMETLAAFERYLRDRLPEGAD